jgi:IS605 OrfB family transposase
MTKEKIKKTKKAKVEKDSVTRSGILRIFSTPDQRRELYTLFTNHQEAAREIQTATYKLSGLKLYDKTNNMVVDGSKATPEEQEAYYKIINWEGQPISISNPMVRATFKSIAKVKEDIRRKQEEYAKLEEADLTKMSTGDVKKHKNELRRAANRIKHSEEILQFAKWRLADIFPLPLSHNSQLHLKNNYHQNVFSGFHARVKGWNACDIAAQANYAEIDNRLTELSSELSGDYGSDVITDLMGLLQYTKELGEGYTDTSYLNYKFLSFFKECWRPNAIANNTGLLEGFWLANNKHTNKKNQVAYSFNPKISEELFRRRSLWESDKCLLSDPRFEKYVELFDKHGRYRKGASLTLISKESPIPIGFSMDRNAAKLVRIDNDTANRQLTITIELPNKEERSYVAAYGRKHETKCYYNGLTTRLPRSEKELLALAKAENRELTDKEIHEASLEKCYIFEYARAGKIPVFAVVKTLYFRRNPSNGEYYVILPTNIFVEYHANNEFNSKELFKIRSSLQTAWKEVRTPNRNVQSCVLDKDLSKCFAGRTLKYAGIDLGYSNPYTVSYYNVVGTEEGIQIKETGNEIVSTVFNEQYIQLKGNIYQLINIIRASRRYLQESGELKLSKDDIKSFDQLMELLPSEQRITIDQFIKDIKKVKQEGKLIRDIKGKLPVEGKKKEYWVISNLMYVITQTMNGIRGNRDSNNHLTEKKNWLSAPPLIELIDAYYNLKKTFNDSGDGIKMLPKDHVYAEGEKQRCTLREENFCKGILEWRDNVKDYFIKKLFSQIAHRCYELGIGIVAMENLDIMGSSKNTKQSNRMFNIWPRGQMKKSAEDAFSYMGILIQYVDENGTSRHDADSGIYGCRDGANLWLPNKKLHADVNASRMIALRGLTHHTNLYCRSLTEIENGKYVNTYELFDTTKDDQSGAAKRLRGAETLLHGYSATVYQIHTTNTGAGVALLPDLTATDVIKNKKITATKENTAKYYKLDNTNTYYPWSVCEKLHKNWKLS